jgi:hypothetical protein
LSAQVLLRELEDASIRLHRNGDRLRAEIAPTSSLDPYRDRIHQLKPEVLKELLQREIVAAASADPAHFDRDAYDALWSQWRVLEAQETSQ